MCWGFALYLVWHLALWVWASIWQPQHPLGTQEMQMIAPPKKPRTTICILTRSWSDSFAKFEKSRLPQAPRSVHACLLNHFSHIRLSVPLWTVAHQAPLSMGFSRQGYWSGLPFPTWGTRSVDALVLEAEPRRIYWKFCSWTSILQLSTSTCSLIFSSTVICLCLERKLHEEGSVADSYTENLTYNKCSLEGFWGNGGN